MQVAGRPGESFLIEPAGEMWSVVTLSPSSASTRAPVMSLDRRGLGGHALEVRRLAHVGRLVGPTRSGRPSGTSSAFQRSSPSKTSP